MAFRKPITTLCGLMFWNNIKQDEEFIGGQEHEDGMPVCSYKVPDYCARKPIWR